MVCYATTSQERRWATISHERMDTDCPNGRRVSWWKLTNMCWYVNKYSRRGVEHAGSSLLLLKQKWLRKTKQARGQTGNSWEHPAWQFMCSSKGEEILLQGLYFFKFTHLSHAWKQQREICSIWVIHIATEMQDSNNGTITYLQN